MKMNKKIKIITMVALCAALLPVYKTFAKISLDDAFRAGTKKEHITAEIGGMVDTYHYKFAWASTRKEENGIETYEGKHYLRCCRKTLFGYDCDTGRVWKDRGFYLEGGRAPDGFGGFKAFYGDGE